MIILLTLFSVIRTSTIHKIHTAMPKGPFRTEGDVSMVKTHMNTFLITLLNFGNHTNLKKNL